MTLTSLTTRRDDMINSHAAYTDFILSLAAPNQRPGMDTVQLAHQITMTKSSLLQLYRQVAKHFYDHGFEDGLDYQNLHEPPELNTDTLFKGA